MFTCRRRASFEQALDSFEKCLLAADTILKDLHPDKTTSTMHQGLVTIRSILPLCRSSTDACRCSDRHRAELTTKRHIMACLSYLPPVDADALLRLFRGADFRLRGVSGLT